MKHKKRWYRIGFTALLIGVFLLIYWLFRDFFSLERFLRYTHALETLVQKRYGTAVLAYIFAYAFVAAIGLPITIALTMMGGFVFGCLEGFVYTVLASTLGAIVAFVIIRRWASPYIERKYGRFLERFRYYFQRSGVYYIFALQLLPIMPFGAITALAALSSMRLITFTFAIFFASMPVSWIYTCTASHIKALALTGKESGHTGRFLTLFTLLGVIVLVYAFVSTLRAHEKKD